MTDNGASGRAQSFSQHSESSQTAQEYIAAQLALEEEAREALPYQFDNCTRPLGPLRQTLFSCLTCNPPPADPADAYTPAGVCYSCSISCHGEHELVELFTRRNFVCDCGSTRLPASSPCSLQTNPQTGAKGNVRSQEPSNLNTYNHNFQNRFCACGETYDAHKENRTMFQCLGLGTVQEGGCGEDWWHPECLLGKSRQISRTDKPVESATPQDAPLDRIAAPLPPGFPLEDDFEHVLCYKCTSAFPWIKRYGGAPGFLPPVLISSEDSSNPSLPDQPTVDSSAKEEDVESKKRKAEDADSDSPPPKKTKSETEPAPEDSLSQASVETKTESASKCRFVTLPPAPDVPVTLFLKEDFRDLETLCKCSDCFPRLACHAQLLEEEEAYEPPLSESSVAGGDNANGHSAAGSTGNRSLLDRGEAALSNVDRVRAIEGVMVYNNLRDKVKAFLKPFAESGQAVGAEDIKEYFEKLRGDDEAIRRAAAAGAGGSGGDDSGDSRREQSGY